MGWGIALVVGGALLALLVAFGLWRVAHPLVALAASVVCGFLVGAGALLMQDDVTGAEWAVTLIALGSLAPLHARLVFGRPGAAA